MQELGYANRSRALGEVGRRRTWNLLFDVIAQSARHAPGETDPKKFLVEGEQRDWVHVLSCLRTGSIATRLFFENFVQALP